MPDIIAEFVDRLLAIAPDMDVGRADRLAYELRQRWGGERVYISRCPADQTETGLRIGTLSATQVSRRTWYRRR